MRHCAPTILGERIPKKQGDHEGRPYGSHPKALTQAFSRRTPRKNIGTMPRKNIGTMPGRCEHSEGSPDWSEAGFCTLTYRP